MESTPYKALNLVGLVLTTMLLISLTFGKRERKKHPVVIAFMATAMIFYWVAILPWMFHIWDARPVHRVTAAGQANIVSLHISCRINAILDSYFQTVFPAFAATFVGEVFKISLQVWKCTSNVNAVQSSPSPNLERNASVASRTAQLPADGHETNHSRRNFDQQNLGYGVFSHTPPRSLDDAVDISTYSSSNLAVDSEVELKHSQHNKRHNHLSLGVDPTPPNTIRAPTWQGRLALCLLPFMCGLPQLVLVILIYLKRGSDCVFVDVNRCRVRSDLVDKISTMIRVFVMNLTLWFSAAVVYILWTIHRAANKSSKSNLDSAFLIRIGVLSMQSMLGCLVVTVVPLMGRDYRGTPDMFLILSPIISAIVLIDKEFFVGWTRLLLPSRWATQKSSNTGTSTDGPGNCESTRDGQAWKPPKPSYPRRHRAETLCLSGHLDMKQDEDYFSFSSGNSNKSTNKRDWSLTSNQLSWLPGFRKSIPTNRTPVRTPGSPHFLVETLKTSCFSASMRPSVQNPPFERPNPLQKPPSEFSPPRSRRKPSDDSPSLRSAGSMGQISCRENKYNGTDKASFPPERREFPPLEAIHLSSDRLAKGVFGSHQRSRTVQVESESLPPIPRPKLSSKSLTRLTKLERPPRSINRP